MKNIFILVLVSVVIALVGCSNPADAYNNYEAYVSTTTQNPNNGTEETTTTPVVTQPVVTQPSEPESGNEKEPKQPTNNIAYVDFYVNGEFISVEMISFREEDSVKTVKYHGYYKNHEMQSGKIPLKEPIVTTETVEDGSETVLNEVTKDFKVAPKCDKVINLVTEKTVEKVLSRTIETTVSDSFEGWEYNGKLYSLTENIPIPRGENNSRVKITAKIITNTTSRELSRSVKKFTLKRVVKSSENGSVVKNDKNTWVTYQEADNFSKTMTAFSMSCALIGGKTYDSSSFYYTKGSTVDVSDAQVTSSVIKTIQRYGGIHLYVEYEKTILN